MSTLPLFDREEPRGGGRQDRVYRVSQVNRMVRALLEDRFPNLWVEGELSDVSHAASGHVYFTLNDEDEPAQLRGVMFRSDAQRTRVRLQDGARVKLRGALTLFEPRGGFQLIARIALPYGLGELRAQFEAVRKRLAGEGLLDAERKRPLPRLPRLLGVVTSRDGAALHDIVRVALDRCPLRIVVAPCTVQGPDAPRSIAAALTAIGALPGLDVVIVGRGGGAAEDLVAFNDERVARAIAGCPVPVVSAVGHEVDVTIADLVADARAATPSNAAELCVPDHRALSNELASRERALQRALEMNLARRRLSLDRLTRRLEEPRSGLRIARSRLQALGEQLTQALDRRLRADRRQLADGLQRLNECDPRRLLAIRRRRLWELELRVQGLGEGLLSQRRGQLAALSVTLDALSPLSILARGYAIALHEPSGRALLRAGEAQVGDLLQLRLHEGSLRARVESTGDQHGDRHGVQHASREGEGEGER